MHHQTMVCSFSNIRMMTTVSLTSRAKYTTTYQYSCKQTHYILKRKKGIKISHSRHSNKNSMFAQARAGARYVPSRFCCVWVSEYIWLTVFFFEKAMWKCCCLDIISFEWLRVWRFYALFMANALGCSCFRLNTYSGLSVPK